MGVGLVTYILYSDQEMPFYVRSVCTNKLDLILAEVSPTLLPGSHLLHFAHQSLKSKVIHYQTQFVI